MERRIDKETKLLARLAELKSIENDLRLQGIRTIAGVDEVGRGPLAGPVVTACLVLSPDFDVLGVDDSKKLSERKREELYPLILEKTLAYGIGMVDNLIIDEINILEATKAAMIQAVKICEWNLRDTGCGIDHILFDAMTIESIGISQTSIIKGDSKSLSIAAASIIAKVTRDRLMNEYHQSYPDYCFNANKGYGTRAHYEGIAKAGLCPIHRRSFLKNIENTNESRL